MGSVFSCFKFKLELFFIKWKSPVIIFLQTILQKRRLSNRSIEKITISRRSTSNTNRMQNIARARNKFIYSKNLYKKYNATEHGKRWKELVNQEENIIKKMTNSHQSNVVHPALKDSLRSHGVPKTNKFYGKSLFLFSQSMFQNRGKFNSLLII